MDPRRPLSLKEKTFTPERDYRSFRLKFFRIKLNVTVTHEAEAIRRWIRDVRNHNRRFLSNGRLIVGLSLGGELSDYVSTIHLSVGRHCLIIQLRRLSDRREALEILNRFFSDKRIKFVGIYNGRHALMLENSGIEIGRIYDLKDYLYEENENASYKEIVVKAKINYQFDLNPHVTNSNWRTIELDDNQISQAAADAFVRLRIGVKLREYVL